MEAEPLIWVKELRTSFHTEYGVVRAVDGVSLYLHKGESLGIVGESGSGKTVTAMSIMGLIENPGRIEGGRILFRGEDLLQKSEREMEALRGGEIAMVFQDSLSSLNPTLSVGTQIGRVLRYHTRLGARGIRRRTVELLELVGIPEPHRRASNFPHELSGGMRQRVLIAMALSSDPALLILDEPTTALDVTIEAQIFELIERLKREIDMGIILITHDLSVVVNSCSRVLVMYSGRIAELGELDAVFRGRFHPYTRGLIASIPRIEGGEGELYSIPGEVPDLITLPPGCNFAPRCGYAVDACNATDPDLREIEPGHSAACIRAEEIRHGGA
jgi:oligopeptide/dipeptide ABC transporter ATP-binding protein